MYIYMCIEWLWMYINYACAQCLVLQNFYGFNVIIALIYVSYAVLLVIGIEEEITSEPEPVY
jgi:hypothetical protein